MLSLPRFALSPALAAAILAFAAASTANADLPVINTGQAGFIHSYGASVVPDVAISQAGNWDVLLTPEWDQHDLNGDSDVYDVVVQLVNRATGTVVNTGLATVVRSYGGSIVPTEKVKVIGGALAVIVSESDENQDLNGNSSVYDAILHLVSLTNGAVTNTHLAVQERSYGGSEVPDSVMVDAGSAVAVLVPEWEQNGDLNGNGSVYNAVLHLVNVSTGAVTNTHLAGLCRPLGGGPPLPRHTVVAGQGKVAFLVPEWEQQGDLNGDGDINDAVLQLVDVATGTVTNTHLAGLFQSRLGNQILRDPMTLASGKLAIPVPEWDQNQDLNGDGGKFDAVLELVDLASGTVTNTGTAVVVDDEGGAPAAHPPIVAQGMLATLVPEWTVAQDLNGDGDQYDAVLELVNLATGAHTNTGLAGYVTAYAGSLVPDEVMVPVGGSLALMVPEWDQNQDLNADGDVYDVVVEVVHLAGGTHVNTGRAVFVRPYSGSLIPERVMMPVGGAIAVLVPEWDQNADLDGDSDVYDVVADLVDASSGAHFNTGLSVLIRPYGNATIPPTVMYDASGTLALLVPEWDEGHDLNGDLDVYDAVMHVVAAPSGPVVNTHLAGFIRQFPGGDPFPPDAIKLIPSAIAMLVPEWDQNADLNGNLSVYNVVLHIVGLPGGSVFNTGLAGPNRQRSGGLPLPRVGMLQDADWIAMAVPEWDQHGDLNGDGDDYDAVEHVINVTKDVVYSTGLPALAQDYPGSGDLPLGVLFSNGTLSMLVPEWNHHDLNGDGDVSDAVLHIVNPPVTAAPEVRSPLAWGIRDVRPNPSAGAITLGARLTGGEPARLEIIDIAGRCRWRRELRPDARAGEVRLQLQPSLPPGVYMVRLRQGALESDAKVCVIR